MYPPTHTHTHTGAVLLDQVFLEDTANLWDGQHTRADVVERIQEMGFGVMRNGGSQCNADGYRWKRFRGAVEDREPFDGTWYKNFDFSLGHVSRIPHASSWQLYPPPTTKNKKITTPPLRRVTCSTRVQA